MTTSTRAAEAEEPPFEDLEGLEDPEDPAGPEGPRRKSSGKRRKPVKASVIWLHRWISLALGLALLLVTTTGAILVYGPELERHARGDVYLPATDRGQGQQLIDSVAAAQEYDPDFRPMSAWDNHGTHIVMNYDTGRTLTVDPSTGEVLGEFNDNKRAPGALGWTLAFAYNVHLCFLTCEGYPGYQAWLAKEIPGSEWAGFEGYKITWGGLILGITGLMMLFLALSGIWLWWPTFKRFSHGLRVRWRKGRYARDYDLHQVVGMIALPLLLLWGLTGAGYEFGFVEKGWYAVLPGDHPDETEFVSEKAPPKTEDISPAVALAAAQASVNTTQKPAGYDLPYPGDPTSTYTFWFQDGVDPYGATEYAGDMGVAVDRHDATRTGIIYGGPNRPVSEQLWTEWNYPLHSGFVVSGWWRVPWLIGGLVPLLLAWTGVSTWLYKRGTRKARKKRAAASVSA